MHFSFNYLCIFWALQNTGQIILWLTREKYLHGSQGHYIHLGISEKKAESGFQLWIKGNGDVCQIFSFSFVPFLFSRLCSLDNTSDSSDSTESEGVTP